MTDIDRDEPTDPAATAMITQEDILSYLVGAVQRIELQVTQEPPWASRLFEAVLNLVSRVEKLESEVSRIKIVCAYRHDGYPPAGK